MVDLSQLAKADRQLAGKKRTIARRRARHQTDRDRTRAAEVAAAAADRRAERAIESMGRDQHALSRENAELADALRKARQDLQTEKRNNAQLRDVIGKFRADAEQRELAERQVPTQLIRTAMGSPCRSDRPASFRRHGTAACRARPGSRLDLAAAPASHRHRHHRDGSTSTHTPTGNRSP